MQLTHPEMEAYDDVKGGLPLQPIYPSTENSKQGPWAGVR
jgi:hypothetical protein